MYHVDLHTHTRFFHGRRDLGDRFDPFGHRLLTWVADGRGLDGIATTNHDYYTPFDAGPVATMPGIEISTDRGHVLVVGPDPPAETESGSLTPAEAVELAHDRDCAAIVAHPFRNSTVREVNDVPFDAIEVNGKHPRSLPLVEQLAEKWGLPLVGGSDAHYPFEVGRAYTEIDADQFTPEAIVDAIRDDRVDYRIERGSTNRLLRRLYQYVHGQKGVTNAFDRLNVGQTPGIGTPPAEDATEPPAETNAGKGSTGDENGTSVGDDEGSSAGDDDG